MGQGLRPGDLQALAGAGSRLAPPAPRAGAHNDFALGATQLVQVAPDLWVANMVGRHGLKTSRSSAPPIRYDAVRQCLHALAAHAARLAAGVHELTSHDIPVTVYDRA